MTYFIQKAFSPFWEFFWEHNLNLSPVSGETALSPSQIKVEPLVRDMFSEEIKVFIKAENNTLAF